MKKIVFVINNLETGGVQTSLINLLKEIHKIFDITILFFNFKEEYKKKLPENVKILYIKSPFKYFGVSQKELKENKIEYFKRAFWAFLIKVFGRSNIINVMSLFQKKIGFYDCAVSYLHEGPQKSVYSGCNEFVLKKVIAAKKITWLHCDFELSGANNLKSKKIYEKFDEIIACSNGCRESFIKCLPNLKYKTKVIRNCNDYLMIKKLSEPAIEYDKCYLNIITVARLSQEKGIERAIFAIKYCIDNGYKIKYHIVGSGEQEFLLKKLVNELKLEDNIFFYGEQLNPYKYIVNADLFLLTSYHEAAPMVFDEAMSLGVPVFSTKTTSAKEMIIDVNGGFVCENSQNSISYELLKVVSDFEKIIVIKRKLKSLSFNNDISINKLCDSFF